RRPGEHSLFLVSADRARLAPGPCGQADGPMLDYASGDPAPGDRPPEPSAMSDSGFVLKTTPPRMSRSALLRERLAREADGVFDSTALAVVAPAGFGKTTLLLQWR